MKSKILYSLSFLFNVALTALMCLLFFVVGLLIINKLVNKDSVVSFNGYYIFNVASGSMVPTLDVGDFIVVKKSENYDVGDVITYKIGSNFVTHRIIKIENNEVVTKGDANSLEDDAIDVDDITGKVVVKLGFLNSIFGVMSNKNMIYFLFMLIVIIYMFSLVKKSRRE